MSEIKTRPATRSLLLVCRGDLSARAMRRALDVGLRTVTSDQDSRAKICEWYAVPGLARSDEASWQLVVLRMASSIRSAKTRSILLGTPAIHGIFHQYSRHCTIIALVRNDDDNATEKHFDTALAHAMVSYAKQVREQFQLAPPRSVSYKNWLSLDVDLVEACYDPPRLSDIVTAYYAMLALTGTGGTGVDISIPNPSSQVPRSVIPVSCERKRGQTLGELREQVQASLQGGARVTQNLLTYDAGCVIEATSAFTHLLVSPSLSIDVLPETYLSDWSTKLTVMAARRASISLECAFAPDVLNRLLKRLYTRVVQQPTTRLIDATS